MERLTAPPGAARSVILTVGVILVAIILSRLILERTGTGLLIFALALPVVFFVAAALVGIGRAAVLLAVFAATALLVRVILLETGWVVLLLAPVIGITAYVLATTIRVLRHPLEPSSEDE